VEKRISHQRPLRITAQETLVIGHPLAPGLMNLPMGVLIVHDPAGSLPETRMKT